MWQSHAENQNKPVIFKKIIYFGLWKREESRRANIALRGSRVRPQSLKDRAVILLSSGDEIPFS